MGRLTKNREQEIRSFSSGWTGVAPKLLFTREEVRALAGELLAELDAVRADLAAAKQLAAEAERNAIYDMLDSYFQDALALDAVSNGVHLLSYEDRAAWIEKARGR